MLVHTNLVITSRLVYLGKRRLARTGEYNRTVNAPLLKPVMNRPLVFMFLSLVCPAIIGVDLCHGLGGIYKRVVSCFTIIKGGGAAARQESQHKENPEHKQTPKASKESA